MQYFCKQTADRLLFHLKSYVGILSSPHLNFWCFPCKTGRATLNLSPLRQFGSFPLVTTGLLRNEVLPCSTCGLSCPRAYIVCLRMRPELLFSACLQRRGSWLWNEAGPSMLVSAWSFRMSGCPGGGGKGMGTEGRESPQSQFSSLV